MAAELAFDGAGAQTIERPLLASLALLLAMGCTHPRPHAGEPVGPRLAPCPNSPNCVSSQADDPSHRIEPLRFTGDPANVMSELRRIIEAMPRARIVAQGPGYLQAEFTSLIFRFRDDLTLLLDAQAGVVHVRSASRLGYSDLGVNRRRVETIRAALATVSA